MSIFGGALIGGAITNLSDGVYSARRKKYEGGRAMEILDQISKILNASNTVLENHKADLQPEEYADLKKAYVEYDWNVANEAQEIRSTASDIIQKTRYLSGLYVTAESHVERANNLLRKVETFQSTVLSSSRGAKMEIKSFDDELPAQTASGQLLSSGAHTSLPSTFDGPNCPSSVVDSISPRDDEGQALIARVTHFPLSTTEPTGGMVEARQAAVGGIKGDNFTFRHTITLENEHEQLNISISDKKLHALNVNDISSAMLKAMFEYGVRLLDQPDAQSPGDQDMPSKIPSLQITVQRLSKLSLTLK